ncbi:hypothetical protein EPR50_G00154190 [Perca flavescens]|uniref:Uncharacterized protein n=1 Tax=Perca flavescens TaxID=8167 RepID=A0A484CG87_PERFV|nr:hypothetical protein EPR50_G00154190 [Perca flavescens]
MDGGHRAHHYDGEDKRKRGNRKKGPGSECRDGPPDFAAAGRGCLDSNRVKEKRRSSRLEAGVSCHSSGIVTKQPFTLRGALYWLRYSEL